MLAYVVETDEHRQSTWDPASGPGPVVMSDAFGLLIVAPGGRDTTRHVLDGFNEQGGGRHADAGSDRRDRARALRGTRQGQVVNGVGDETEHRKAGGTNMEAQEWRTL